MLAATRTLLVAVVLATGLAASSHAQSLCDLLPASAVQAALGISTPLTAKPNMEGGNGCDYQGSTPGLLVVTADTSSAAGLAGTLFTQRLGQLGDATLVAGMGEAAYYRFRHFQHFPLFPRTFYTLQSLVFRAKGKIVSFLVTTPGNGLPRTAILALGNLALSKPLNTLQDPK